MSYEVCQAVAMSTPMKRSNTSCTHRIRRIVCLRHAGVLQKLPLVLPQHSKISHGLSEWSAFHAILFDEYDDGVASIKSNNARLNQPERGIARAMRQCSPTSMPK
jgi:hypothetical protein